MSCFIGFLGILAVVASVVSLGYMVAKDDPELNNFFDED